MYKESAAIYDAIYRSMGKDYAAESARLQAFIAHYKRSAGNDLLDAACGTGSHIPYLRAAYRVEGLDYSDEMLAIARQKNPGITFHHASMVDFRLDRQYDVITCLFSAIGYVETLDNLSQTIQTFARHLKPGGIALVEPWFSPEAFGTDKVHALFVDEPDLKIARMNVNRVEGRLSFLDFQYMVGTPAGIEHYSETGTLGLFTHEEYMRAFGDAGLQVTYDETGLDGRGLYIGCK